MKKVSLKRIIALQIIVIIYTFSTVFAKLAAQEKFFSFKFIIFIMLELLILFIYAVLWQQIIKKTELSIAYMNKSLALFWSMLWSFFIFEEKISINNIIGVVIILLGIVIINTEKEEEKEYVE
mgnify:FL=1